MKYLVTLLLFALAIVASVHAQIQVRPRPPRSVFPPPNRPFGLPRPPRDRPFGLPRPPKPSFRPIQPPRFVRSVNNDGISWNVDLDRGKPSWNVGAQKKIYENKHGSIHVNGGIGAHRGGRPQGQVGLGGSFSWGK